jgi:hypothetical protein
VNETTNEKSQNYCSSGDRMAELNIHPEDPVSTKIDISFTNPRYT